jgi:hypothetical protein
VDTRSIPTRLYDAALKWRDELGIADSMHKWVPSIMDNVKAKLTRRIIEDRMNGLAAGASTVRRAQTKENQGLIEKAMSFTFNNIDPRRPWDKHTWLENSPNKAELQKEVQRANQAWNELKRKGLDKVYALHNNTNRALQFAALTGAIRDTIKRDHSTRLGMIDRDPYKEFQFSSALHNDPRKAADFWQKRLDDHLSTTQKFLSSVRAAADLETDPVKKQQMLTAIQSLSSIERDASRALAASSQAPNFALGRKGDHFVSGTLVKGFTQAHIQKFQDALQKAGFNNIVMSHNAENDEGRGGFRPESKDQLGPRGLNARHSWSAAYMARVHGAQRAGHVP